MRVRAKILIAFVLCLKATIGFSQESETAELNQQIELLAIKLELAEKSAELLETELESLRKENVRLKGEDKKTASSQDDPFEPGSVWAGEAINNDKLRTHWALSVAERNGRKFEGAIAAINEDGKKHEIAVSGYRTRERQRPGRD